MLLRKNLLCLCRSNRFLELSKHKMSQFLHPMLYKSQLFRGNDRLEWSLSKVLQADLLLLQLLN